MSLGVTNRSVWVITCRINFSLALVRLRIPRTLICCQNGPALAIPTSSGLIWVFVALITSTSKTEPSLLSKKKVKQAEPFYDPHLGVAYSNPGTLSHTRKQLSWVNMPPIISIFFLDFHSILAIESGLTWASKGQPKYFP